MYLKHTSEYATPSSLPVGKILEVGRGMVGVLEGMVVAAKYLHWLVVAPHQA